MIAMSHSMTDHKKHATHQKQTNLIKSISLISPLRTIDESARLPVTAYCLWQQPAVHCDTVCHSVPQCDTVWQCHTVTQLWQQRATAVHCDTVWHSVTQCNSSLPRTDDPTDLCHVKIWNPFWFTFLSFINFFQDWTFEQIQSIDQTFKTSLIDMWDDFCGTST